jgi:hypothetical protein
MELLIDTCTAMGLKRFKPVDFANIINGEEGTKVVAFRSVIAIEHESCTRQAWPSWSTGLEWSSWSCWWTSVRHGGWRASKLNISQMC